MSARNRELLALLPVALLVTAGFTAVFLVERSQIGNVSLLYGGYFLAVCVAVHIFLRIRIPYADPYLFPLCALLAAVGLVVLFRVNDTLALKQASIFVAGAILLALTVVFVRDYQVLERYRYLIATAGILLLLAPRLPGLGTQVNGAYLGIKAGPLSFQPAEVAKICIVIFLASYLHERRELLSVGARRVLGVTIPPLKHFGPLFVVWGAAMAMLVLIRDLGSSLMFFGAFLALVYVATNRLSYVLAGAAAFLRGAAFLAAHVAHVHDCGSILPAPHTDEIYAVIVSELGLFGGVGLVVVYALIGARGYKAAVMAPDGFSKLLAAGLTTVFVLQAFVIVGGVVNLIPLTGVTLPFVSYGGSSVIANMVLLALLLLVSDRARRPAPELAPLLEGTPA